MKQLVFLFLCMTIACNNEHKEKVKNGATKTEVKKDTTDNKVKIFFKSDTENELFVSTSHTMAEIFNTKIPNLNISSGDSISVELNGQNQLFNVGQPFRFYFNILANANDSYLIEYLKDTATIKKIVNQKNVSFEDLENEKYRDNNLKLSLNNQIEKIKTLKEKSLLKSEIDNYLEKSNTFYNHISDSLSALKNNRAVKLQELVLLDQYDKLLEIHTQMSSIGYAGVLTSTKFLNPEFLKNRNLLSMFAKFYHYNFRLKSNKNLELEYKSGFNNFPKEAQSYFKFLALGSMIDRKYNRKTISQYLDDYAQMYGTNQAIDNLKKEIDYGIAESEDLYLQSVNEQKETWKSVLKKNKGKLIYVDFWASWCRPCIAELPFSKKLAKSHKDVIFIYLAHNDEEKAWRKAVEKYDMKENNFLITNSKTSKLINEYKIVTIPRYMIVNKQGKVIHPDAPRPSSSEIETIFNQLK